VIEIELAYSRIGRIKVEKANCDVCKKKGIAVLCVDGSEGEYGEIFICQSCTASAFQKSWRKSDDLIDDGYQEISAWCPNGCGKTMQVVRPGSFQCSECG